MSKVRHLKGGITHPFTDTLKVVGKYQKLKEVRICKEFCVEMDIRRMVRRHRGDSNSHSITETSP